MGSVDHYLATYGYWAVGTAVGVESLGVPFPGETMLISAGLYAGITHHLSPGWVVFWAAVGAIVGDNIGFWIGDKVGWPLVRRYGPYVRIDEGVMKMGRYLFDRYGGEVVFFGRFVSVLRTYAAFLAGVNKLSWRRFLFYNAAGGIVWSCLYGFGAYYLGSSIKTASTAVSWALGGVAAVVVVVAIVLARRYGGRLRARAEKAIPGPLEP